MQLNEMLKLSVGFIYSNEILWNLQCSSGLINICEMKHATLTRDMAGQGLLLPATNLRMIDGWIPEVDANIANMLRPETHALAIINCYVKLFVIREFLRVLALNDNIVEKIELIETTHQFELQSLQLQNNRLTDIPFVTKLNKLRNIDLSRNRLKHLEMKWYNNLPNLKFLVLCSHQIKTLGTSNMQPSPIELFTIMDNQLIEFNTKNWHANNMKSINVEKNRIRSINTVQFAKSFPSLNMIKYDRNPWNCGQLKSFQFYTETRKIANYSSYFARCYNDNTHQVALQLPELIDSAEDRLVSINTTARQMKPLNFERIQARFSKSQASLQAAKEGLDSLKQKYELLRNGLELFDFYDKL